MGSSEHPETPEGVRGAGHCCPLYHEAVELVGRRWTGAILRVLMDGMARRGSPSVLAFYGDHLPSLSNAFRHFGFDEWSSDYAIWPGVGAPQHRDIDAWVTGPSAVAPSNPCSPSRSGDRRLH